MAVMVEVVCRYCGQIEPVRKHGVGKAGFPRYYCKDCRKTFQLNYCYYGHQSDMNEKIVDMAMNGSGIRLIQKEKFGLRTDANCSTY
ncbi:hypothetical protein KKJ22_04715 [Xenorhabdus bovienii]|nr:hypothetical protein [Xenorhabdus bovienii]